MAACLGLVVLPLLVAAVIDPHPVPRPRVVDFSVGLGFLALASLVVQFALVSRFGPASRSLGSDALMQMHRGLGVVVLLFVLAHPLLLAGTGLGWRAWNPFAGPLRAGAIGTWAVALIVATSFARARLRLRYEVWHVLHLLLAVVAVGGAVAHARAVGGYTAAPMLGGLVLAYAAAAGLVVVHYRLGRPWRMWRRPWRVVENDDIGGSTRRVRVVPDGHAGFAFQPGQFAWMATSRSPMLAQEHPLSIASSAEIGPDGAIEFAIKALGDWSGGVVPGLRPGARLWVDGPFGAFSPDRWSDATGLTLIAGGIGIAPMRAMLLSMRDRRDGRPVVLFYAASDATRAVFLDELRALEADLALRVVSVFERPGAGWSGERGFVTGEVLARHLPADRRDWEYFACGPLPMMAAVERALLGLGVPAARVHTERFQLV
jgi:predicted ferric reductase